MPHRQALDTLLVPREVALLTSVSNILLIVLNGSFSLSVFMITFNCFFKIYCILLTTHVSCLEPPLPGDGESDYKCHE